MITRFAAKISSQGENRLTIIIPQDKIKDVKKFKGKQVKVTIDEI